VFTGALFGREKYECYGAVDLFMLPSLCEGLPTVLLEASAMGIPIVATSVGGIPDIVVHGKTGFLVDKLSVELYARYAANLLEHKDLAEKIGKNAREHVKTNFLWSTVAEKYERIFEKLAR